MITPVEIAPSSAPAMVKTARATSGQSKFISFKLTDGLGKPTQNPGPFRLRVMNGELGSKQILFDLPLTINGLLVEGQLTETLTNDVGVFDGMIAAGEGDSVNETWPFLLLLEPSAFQTFQASGPLTIPEIRMALLDTYNLDEGPFSSLLDGMEFSDVEIAWAIRRAVDLFNEMQPPSVYYTTQNFPYRYNWTQGTSGILLRMAAARYRRNRLAYSAGGVSIDDQSKAQEYEEIGNQRLQEYMQYVKTEKTRINMEYAWSTGL